MLILLLLYFEAALSFQCQATENALTIVKESGNCSNHEKFYIWGDGSLMYQSIPPIDNSVTSYNLCLKPTHDNTYELALDSVYGRWGDNSKIVLLGQYYNRILSETLRDSSKNRYRFSLGYTYKKDVVWKCRVGSEVARWSTDRFVSTSWDDDCDYSQGYDTTYRTFVTSSVLSQSAAVTISVEYMCGICIYLNGRMVYNNNIAFDDGIHASGCYNSLKTHEIIIGGYNLKDENFFAIAVYPALLATPSMLAFSSWSMIYLGNAESDGISCYVVPPPDTILISSEREENPKMIVDGLIGTYGEVETTMMATLEMGMKDMSFEMDGIRFYITSPFSNTIDWFTVKGISGDMVYDFITVDRPSDGTINDAYAYFFMEGNERIQLSTYRMFLFNTESRVKNYHLYEIDFLVCSDYNHAIKYGSIYEYSVFEHILIVPLYYQAQDECFVKGYIPSTLSIRECTLSGAVDTPMDIHIHLVVRNHESITGDIHLVVRDNVIPVSIERVFGVYSMHESFYIYHDNELVYSEGIDNYQMQNNKRVSVTHLENGEYTLYVESPFQVWDNSFITLYCDYEGGRDVIASQTYYAYKSVSSMISFEIDLPVWKLSQWKYHYDDTPENWKTGNIEDWNTLSLSSNTTSDTDIQLYRTDFYLGAKASATNAFIISVQYCDGISIYINGNHAFKALMNKTQIKGCDGYADKSYVNRIISLSNLGINGSLLREGKNSIGIALYGNIDYYTSHFKAYLRIIHDDNYYFCDGILQGVDISADNNFLCNYNADGFDIKSPQSSQSFDIVFGEHTMLYLNRFEFEGALHERASEGSKNNHLRNENTANNTSTSNTDYYWLSFTLEIRETAKSPWMQLYSSYPISISEETKMHSFSVNRDRQSFQAIRARNFHHSGDLSMVYHISYVALCLTRHTDPLLSYSFSINTFTGYQVPRYIPMNHNLIFYVSDYLPTGLEFDRCSGVLSGISTMNEHAAITLYGYYTKENYITTQVIYNNERCDIEINSLIELAMINGDQPYSGDCYVKDEKSVIIFSIPYVPYTQSVVPFQLCLSKGVYSISCSPYSTHVQSSPPTLLLYSLVTMNMYQSWNLMHDTLVYGSFSTVFPMEQQFSPWYIFKRTVNPMTAWKYYLRDRSYWASASPDTRSTVLAAIFGSNFPITMYMYKLIHIPELSMYHVMNCRIYANTGFVVYFNTQRVAYTGLPADYDDKTFGNRRMKVVPFYFSIIPSLYGIMNANNNTMMFEYHCEENSACIKDFYLEVDVTFSVEEQSLLRNSFSLSTSEGSYIDDAFHSQPYRAFIHSEGRGDVYADYTFENMESTFFNSIGVVVAEPLSNAAIEMWGYNDNNEEHLIAEFFELSFDAYQEQIIKVPAGMIGFKYLHFVWKRKYSYHSYIFDYRIGFYYLFTSIYVCYSGDTFPMAPVGQYSVLPAITNYSGYRSRFCNEQGILEPVVFHMKARKPRSILYQQTQYSCFVGMYCSSDIPQVDGLDVFFRLNCDSPFLHGLAFNEDNGQITGTATGVFDTQCDVYAFNELGSILTSIYIEVANGVCLKEGYVPKNGAVNDNYIFDCKSINSYGMITYTCLLDKNHYTWKAIQGNCIRIWMGNVLVVVLGLVVVIAVIWSTLYIRKALLYHHVAVRSKKLFATIVSRNSVST